jgi:hypothetical protein
MYTSKGKEDDLVGQRSRAQAQLQPLTRLEQLGIFFIYFFLKLLSFRFWGPLLTRDLKENYAASPFETNSLVFQSTCRSQSVLCAWSR